MNINYTNDTSYMKTDQCMRYCPLPGQNTPQSLQYLP